MTARRVRAWEISRGAAGCPARRPFLAGLAARAASRATPRVVPYARRREGRARARPSPQLHKRQSGYPVFRQFDPDLAAELRGIPGHNLLFYQS